MVRVEADVWSIEWPFQALAGALVCTREENVGLLYECRAFNL